MLDTIIKMLSYSTKNKFTLTTKAYLLFIRKLL
jgi:hypothetical protein